MKVLVFVLLTSIMLSPVTSATCHASLTGCLSCTSANGLTCNRCKAGYKMTFPGSCSVCPAGYGRAADSADRTTQSYCGVICGKGCRLCGAYPDECYACQAGYRYNVAGKYCQACLPGTGSGSTGIYPSADTTCETSCSSTCRFCDSNPNSCLGCYEGYKLDANFKTCNLCESGKGSVPDAFPKVIAGICDLSCEGEGALICGPKPSIHLACKENFSYNLALKLCTLCPPGTTNGEDFAKRTTSSSCNNMVSSGCQTMSLKAGRCLRCKAGYYYDHENGKSCKVCPAGTGSDADTTDPTASTTCKGKCTIQGCQICDLSGTKCFGCYEGYQFDQRSSTCLSCGAGKGKIDDRGLFPNIYLSCPTTCAANCKFCNDNSSSCVGCYEGYRLDSASKQCIPCLEGTTRPADAFPPLASTWCKPSCITGCASCNPTTPKKCLTCAAGYRTKFVSSDRQCLPCESGLGNIEEASSNNAETFCTTQCDIGCENCSNNPGFCISCKSGYFMSSAGKCKLCPKGKGKTRDLYPTFASPSTTNGQAECSITCHESCGTCRGPGQDECLSCAADFYFNAIQSCTKCPTPGYTKNTDQYTFKIDGSCMLSCDQSCLACRGSAANNCVRCKAGYYTLGDGVCNLCPEGTTKTADQSDKTTSSTVLAECNIQCATGCRMCTGPAASECTSCMGGYKRTSTGTCELCTGNKGTAKQTEAVGPVSECTLNCSPACEACSAANDPDKCLMCSAGHYMVNPGKCRACPNNSGKTKDSQPISTSQSANSVCTTGCDPACKTCSGGANNQCVTCNAGYFSNGSGTCLKCNSGTGKPAGMIPFSTSTESQADCFPCSANCELCGEKAPNTCYSCKAGFYYNPSLLQCVQCPAGLGKTADLRLVDPITLTSPSTQCNQQCAEQCLLCSGSAPSECLICDAGYYIKSSGCTACDAGTGKPADTEVAQAATTSTAACKLTCVQGCDLCFGTSWNQCLRCSKGYYMSSTGVCFQCPAGTGKDADSSDNMVYSGSSSACTKSCPTCLICDGSGACSMCDRGYYYSGSGQCKNCDAKTGKPADTKPKSIAETQAGACTSKCHDGCNTCFGSQANQCLICNRAYYKSDQTTCTMCPQGTGKDGDSSVTPKSGFYDPVKECTIQCDPTAHCHTCYGTGLTQCANCQESHFLFNSVCILCNNGKTKPADTTLTMYTQVNRELVCVLPCHPSCEACTLDPNFCLKCASNHFWTAEGVCEMCKDGRGGCIETGFYVSPAVETAKCVDCHPACLGCRNPLQNWCTRCRAGEYRHQTMGCAVCPPGKGKTHDPYDVLDASSDNGVTECKITCHANCQNCFGTGPNECTTCKTGFYFSGSGTCTACPENKTKAADTTSQILAVDPETVCVSCHISCLTCNGVLPNNCLSCNGGHFFTGNGICSPCDPGTGKLSDVGIPTQTTSTVCTISCDRRCNVCKGPGPNDCLSCAAGYWWAGDGVCTRCNSQTGKSADIFVLTSATTIDACDLSCASACLTCSVKDSATSCIQCSAGHYLSDGNTCRSCAKGTGKPDDVGFSQISTSNGEKECRLTCHSSCSTCSDATAQGCVTCNEGFFLSSKGTCTLCAHGTGKPADEIALKSPQTSVLCKACDASCAHCSYPNSPEGCLSCNHGFYLSQRGLCSPCPSGFGKTADSGIVALTKPNSDGTAECTVRCHPSCKMCKGPGATDCLNCNSGYFWTGAGVCTGCPAGFGKVDDGTNIPTTVLTSAACVIPCHDNCQNCFADTAQSCLSCKAGYFKSANGVCTMCSSGNGKLADTEVNPLPSNTAQACKLTCAVACSACTGPTASDCTACSNGHYMSAAGTCTKCPFGTGKPFDEVPPKISDETVCTVKCHDACSSCGDETALSCSGCNKRFFWNNGVCNPCPISTSKLTADLDGFAPQQTASVCSLKCHPSCQHCTGPAANECLSCSPGYWLSAKTECTKCPAGRGKAADEVYPSGVATEEACNIYCDSCSSGCQTCSDDPFECVSCVSDRYLSSEKTCGLCPDHCLACADKNKCDKCAKNFKLTPDAKGCIGDCTVENCILCAEDPSKCTKCNEEFVLKSPTECVKDTGVVATNDLSTLAILDSPQLNVDIRSDKLELAFGPTESRNFTSVTLQDKLSGKVYSCAEVSCTYSIKNDKLSMDFNPGFVIVKGKLTIERGSKQKTIAPAWVSSHKNQRMMQTQTDYPIVVDGISLMKKSPLNTLGFSLRIVVGVLRLPLSLVLFWKYPFLAMLMDHMVTHLKIYSLLGHPYMAYVEVVFQSVSDSKVLPFNFDNPFEKWDSQTLDCAGFSVIRSKNLHCSWLDNYGQNFIGLLSIGLIILILYYTSRWLASPGQATTPLQRLLKSLCTDYGLKFIAAKLDGNHLEIVLMTTVAYCTADDSSKSVVGLVVSTFTLVVLGCLSHFVTWESQRVYRTKLAVAATGAPTNGDSQVRLRILAQANSRGNEGHQNSQTNPPAAQTLRDAAAAFALSPDGQPHNRWSVYFFAARHVRALLLAIFVTTVRDSVEQVVLVVLLESVYLVVVILFDYRGTKAERFFYATMHGLMLAHLIIRAIATSDSLSEGVVQSQLATAIVVILLVYVFAHIVACMLIVVGLFLKNEQQPAASPEKRATWKVEYTEEEAFVSPPKEKNPSSDQPTPAASLPLSLPLSFQNIDIPEELPENHQFQGEIPSESRQQHSKVDHVRVRLDLPNQRPPSTLAATNSQ